MHILVISVACLYICMTHNKLQRNSSNLNQFKCSWEASLSIRILLQLIASWLHSWHFYHNHTTKALLRGQVCRIKKYQPHQGARKIWGTLKTTTCTAVRNTITSVTKLSSNNLQIKRKYKLSRNNPDNLTKWWFVVRDEEGVRSKTTVWISYQ